MVAWIGLSYCVKQYDYYLTENNKPIFIYETEKDFPPNKDGSLDYTKLKTVFEGRYYINNGALLNVTLKGKKLMDKKLDEADINHLIADVKGYLKLTSARLKK